MGAGGMGTPAGSAGPQTLGACTAPAHIHPPPLPPGTFTVCDQVAWAAGNGCGTSLAPCALCERQSGKVGM